MKKKSIIIIVLACVIGGGIILYTQIPPKKPSEIRIKNTFKKLFNTLPTSEIAEIKNIKIKKVVDKSDTEFSAIAHYDSVFTKNSDEVVKTLLKNKNTPLTEMTSGLMLKNLKKACRIDKVEKGAVCQSRIRLVFALDNSKGWILKEYNRNFKK